MPGKCWKVILAVPNGTSDRRKITAEARVWAVIMPNMQGLGPEWRTYAVRVQDVEELTGFRFFSALEPAVAEELSNQARQRGPARGARRAAYRGAIP